MVGWTRAIPLAGALVAGLCPDARAQTTVFGTGSAELTYTDNLFNASSHPGPGLRARREAWYVTLTPGVGLTHEAVRASYLLAYSHSFVCYLTAIDAQTHGDMATLQGRYELTPVDQLTVGITGTRTSTALPGSDPSFLGQAQVDTTAEFLTATVQQTLEHEYSPNWSGRESTSFSVTKPVGGQGPSPGVSR